MIWQDFVYAVGNVIFALALIPSIRSNDKPAIYTSGITATTLIVFSVTAITLELYLTAFVTVVGALMWTVLVYQKFKQK